MQRLGHVLHITPSGNIILKIENSSKIGETVVDENLKTIGKVFDMIGPVSAPYAVVKPITKELEKLANKILYVVPSGRRKEKVKR